MFWYHRDEENDLEETEDSKQRKETKRVTFALPDDEESGDDEEPEETSFVNAQKEPAEVKSSFEKRQEKVTNRN